jgi:phosphate transport system substrate-binding protein
VEYSYAKANKMSHVMLRNQAGNFVNPDDATFKAAAAGAAWDKSFYQILTEQPGKDAWPITGATFILMHKAQDKPAQAAATLKFFDWAFANGDKMSTELEYVPMPDAVEAMVRRAWADLKDGSGKAIAFQ